MPAIDATTVNRLKQIGAGVAVHPFRYLSGGNAGGPPLRMIIDSGIRVGAGSDSAQISTLNPWNMIYYMVTGKNVAGKLVNGGQQITREEAIRLYTVNNGWFLKEEANLGSIEVGKFGDVVVLSDDYFNAVRVPDESIRKLHPVLTVVDGKVVYSLLRSVIGPFPRRKTRSLASASPLQFAGETFCSWQATRQAPTDWTLCAGPRAFRARTALRSVPAAQVCRRSGLPRGMH